MFVNRFFFIILATLCLGPFALAQPMNVRLLQACGKRGSLAPRMEKLRQLVREGAEINAEYHYTGSQSKWALRDLFGSEISELIKHGPITCLVLAIKMGEVELVEFLLAELRALPLKKTSSINEPMLIAGNETAYDAVTDLDSPDSRARIINLLVEHTLIKNIDSPILARNQSLLQLASSAGAAKAVSHLLQAGANPNAFFDDTTAAPGDHDLRTRPALTQAAWNNHAEVVELLLRAGANANQIDARGLTPLSAAMHYSLGAHHSVSAQTQTLRALVQYGARADAVTIQEAAEALNLEALEFLLNRGIHPTGFAISSLLASSADGGFRGSNKQITKQQQDALKIKMLNRLLDAGADPNEGRWYKLDNLQLAEEYFPDALPLLRSGRRSRAILNYCNDALLN